MNSTCRRSNPLSHIVFMWNLSLLYGIYKSIIVTERGELMIDQDHIYTTDQVAKLLQVHPQTVKRWLRAGELRGALLANRTGWRVLGSDLQAFWDARLNNSAASVSPQSLKTESER
jgi:excisionase family DNA binding protein